MVMPKIAVIMATYNGESYITEQLASIQSQIGVKVTLFVSDDCSGDSTIDRITEFSNSDDCFIDIVFLGTCKKFGSATLNFLDALKQTPVSEFDYVCFSDQDDIWLPNKLSVAISEMEVTSSCGYSSNVLAWDSIQGKTSLVRKSDSQTPYDFMFQGCGPGCTMVLDSNSSSKVILFLNQLSSDELNKIWFHDWFIYAFCRANSISWTIDSYAGMLYRQHATNVIGANSGCRAWIKRFKLLRRWKKETLFLAEILDYKNRLPLLNLGGSKLYFITKPFSARRRLVESFILFILSIMFLI